MKSNTTFVKNLKYLGFEQDNESLYLCSDTHSVEPEIMFHLEIAKEFDVTAVFFKKEIEFFKPQVYIFDYTGKSLNENLLTDIHRKIWTSGNVPLVCILYDTEIKILNTTAPVENDRPNYLEVINLAERFKRHYDNLFAIRIKTGTFWEDEENKKKFNFNNSAYDTLIRHIQSIIQIEKAQLKTAYQVEILKKLIIKCILIRFLEEKGSELFQKNYFNNKPFVESISDYKSLISIFNTLENEFNGNIFSFTDTEKQQIKTLRLPNIAAAFSGEVNEYGQGYIWKLYDFKFIPTELISRLYEEFLAGKDSQKTQKEKKQSEGIYYTPAHLAKLLVDESMPLKNYENVDLKKYKILDPACGSGIFLVLAFKRLVQWWKLKEYEKTKKLNAIPNVKILKQLLNCIYGVDKEEQATKLTTFSLCIALCDELSPMQIIENLKFDDLTQTNILYSDFFVEELNTPKEKNEKLEFEIQKRNFSKLKNIKFDLVIGNPPFDRGAISKYSNSWKEENVSIPQGQIALKFLSDTLPKIKIGGLQCLIIKSSGLLYNSTSENFKKALFSNYNVKQIFDFTALARNNSLWENGADVATAVIFIKNEPPDSSKNILHLTFRRTKATKNKIIFEIDKYDRHYVNRFDAINNLFIWKINLLGGGRIKSIIERTKNINPLKDFLNKNECVSEEGFIVGTNGKLKPNYLFSIPTLPTKFISEKGIDYEKLENLDCETTFVKTPSEFIFKAPNIIFWENIGESKIPAFFNKVDFSFRHQLFGINSKNKKILNSILNELDFNSNFYRFYIFCTSGYLLINRNTSVLKEDFLNIPFLINENIDFSSYENKIINDVLEYNQVSIREGENSKASKLVDAKNLKSTICNYGIEFSKVLNHIYENEGNKFRLSDVICLFDNTFIASIFRYDNLNELPNFQIKALSEFNFQNLTVERISTSLTSTRVITLYEENTIIFIKPNQYRYWLSSIAYRDADECFSDLVNGGY